MINITAINLHHLGVPCVSTIKKTDHSDILGRIKDIDIKNLGITRSTLLREEPAGSTIITPGLYASFIWIDKKTSGLLTNKEYAQIDPVDLVFLYENNVLAEGEKNIIRSFKSEHDELPAQVLFEVTSNCDSDCLACYHARDLNQGQDSLTNLIKRVDFLSDMGLMLFEVTGGEPFMNKDLEIILSEISDKDKNFYVVTNGGHLHKSSDRLIDVLSRSQGIAISIDAYGENHDRIRKNNGLFSRIIRGLDVAKNSGIPVYLVSTLGEHNIDDVSKIIDLAKNYGTKLHLRPAIKTGAAIENLVKSDELYKKIAQYLDHDGSKNGFIATKKTIPESRYYGCGIRKRISVDGFGRLFPCVMDRDAPNVKIEDMHGDTIVSIFTEETRKYLNFNTFCTDCSVNAERLACGGFCRFSKTYEYGKRQ